MFVFTVRLAQNTMCVCVCAFIAVSIDIISEQKHVNHDWKKSLCNELENATRKLVTTEIAT